MSRQPGPASPSARRLFAFALLAPLVIVGCAAGGDAGPSSSASPSPSAGLPDSGPVPSEMFAAMVAEAATAADVDESAVQVVRAEAVTWRDGSMGCPEPGMMYTQALVPGYRVVLSAGGREYHFHADRGANYALCPADRVEEPAPGTDR